MAKSPAATAKTTTARKAPAKKAAPKQAAATAPDAKAKFAKAIEDAKAGAQALATQAQDKAGATIAEMVLTAAATSISKAPSSPWLARVRCPVLAIHGDLDEFGSHAFPRRIAAEVAGPSQLLLLDNCGHVPHRELPQAVLAGVCGFLQQHGVC